MQEAAHHPQQFPTRGYCARWCAQRRGRARSRTAQPVLGACLLLPFSHPPRPQVRVPCWGSAPLLSSAGQDLGQGFPPRCRQRAGALPAFLALASDGLEAAALLRAGLAPQARRSLQGLLSFPLRGLGAADKLRTTAVVSCEVSAPVPAGPAPGGTRRWGDPPRTIPYLCFPATAWPWGCGGLPAASAQLLLQTEGR